MTKTFCDVTGCKNESAMECLAEANKSVWSGAGIPLLGTIIVFIGLICSDGVADFHICEEHSREYRERKNKR